MESKKWLDSADVDPNHLRAHYILRALNVARAMYSIKLHDWQAAAIADVLMHRDVVVSAGTGSGKSIIFQTLPYTVQNGIILVVSPLLSIMYDQASNHVAWLQSNQIGAIALTATEIQARPQALREVAEGKYRLVYASPEVLLTSGSYFWVHILRKPCAFRDNLLAIAVDEAHVVWGYRTFRQEYSNLSDFRAHLRSIPIIALSATLAPNVLGYIHKVLLLASPTIIYRRPIGRANITFAVIPIRQALLAALHELDFLIDRQVVIGSMIPKAFVFVDNVDSAHTIARYLRNLLHPSISARAKDLIKVMSASLEPDTRAQYMRGVKDGLHRIFVGTEVFAMGINFPDIDVIVQWGIMPHLTLAAVWQRIGRAARDSTRHAVACIFVQERYFLPEENDRPGNEGGFYFGWRRAADPARRQSMEEFLRGLYSALAADVRCVLDNIDPALVWFLNTAGCRWRAGICAFGDPSWISGVGIPVPPTSATASTCCDNCFFNNAIEWGDGDFLIGPVDIRRSIRYTYTTEYQETQYCVLFEKNMDVVVAKSNAPSKSGMVLAREKLIEWRATEYNAWVRGLYPSLMPTDFMSEAAIAKITGELFTINSAESLAEVLSPEVHLEYSVLQASTQSLLSLIDSIKMVISPRRRERAPPRPRMYDFSFVQVDPGNPAQAPLLEIQRAIAATDKAKEQRAVQKRTILAARKTQEQVESKAIASWNEKAKGLNLPLRPRGGLRAGKVRAAASVRTGRKE
ncbi:uncharacterized protein H6S33_009391 [Morchella sextelata]|uniref:uncharacterized protein n=1 Tax=Morchella sextelata TaxID=1174677 RepID=UPI001D050D51|nr:uncharacterized protein H6S33_009391 [Morchella sextelata]KAH0613011.1 hypothetical protein H6S33_009391 [Morchella sextelata]